MKNRKISRYINALGEIVLAPLSFLFYRIVRFTVQHLVQLQSRMHVKEATQWRVLEGSAMQKPLNLLALMTAAPRWNTHAIIALAGPFHVQDMLKVHTATAEKSAQSWTLVVHAEPQHCIVASIGSITTSSDEPWQAVQLDPGMYRLALRYYHWSDAVELPAIEVDGKPIVPAVTIAANANDFYRTLSQHSSVFYLCLHTYVCTLLRYRRWFPRAFVEREYLPAGNPQTTFYYGFLEAGMKLSFELDPGLLGTHDVYFTAYNRASFPTLWYQLLETRHSTAPSLVRGSYLIRVHRKTPGTGAFDRTWVRIHTQTADPIREEQQSVVQQTIEI
jgi:Family of unknown function (DUF6208)